jgi:hypothetical protein
VRADLRLFGASFAPNIAVVTRAAGGYSCLDVDVPILWKWNWCAEDRSCDNSLLWTHIECIGLIEKYRPRFLI